MPLDVATYRSTPEAQLPSYMANYIQMFNALNADRQSTLKFLSSPQVDETIGARGGKITTTNPNGFQEMNPLLGNHPSRDQVNAFFAADLAIPYLAKDLPDWAKSSLADTIAFNEQMLTDQNRKMMQTGKSPDSFPIGAKFTYNGDWDMALGNWLSRLSALQKTIKSIFGGGGP